MPGDLAMLRVRHLRGPGVGLDRFDLAVGEAVALRGPSGAGKTLLLRALADLDASSGEISLDGVARDDMPGPAWRRLVGYVAAEPAWWADTVGEHVSDWTAAVGLVETLGFEPDCRRWPVARLSTGERQRLALVRALALRPRVMLLDEPTAGLDTDATAVVERLLTEARGQGMGLLWVTHDDQQAARVASRVLAVERGRAWEVVP
jgi:ABC-type iron transport system FetAB ATPase subunit